MTQSDIPTGQFKDEDLVYVDPDSRLVVGKVEFLANDRPKSLVYKPIVKVQAPGGKEDKKDRGQFWRKFYPFGTYKSMKRIYKLEGKVKEAEPNKTLEQVLPKALSQAFWSWEQTSESDA